MKEDTRRLIGRTLFRIGNALPPTKRWLCRWGLRTSKEWFGERVGRAQLPDGRSLKLASIGQNYLSFELFWRGVGYYEPITTLVAQRLVRPGGTFIDAGANIGFYTLVLSAAQPRLNVLAFEPNPKNFALLVKNVLANRFTGVTCEPLALSDQEGKASLYLSASDMSASLQSDFDRHPAGSVAVRTTTLDAYLADRPIRGSLVVKVDVEGHEKAFFQGAHQTLAAHRPDIITEVALDYDAQAVEFLRDVGYRWYQITDQGLLEATELTPVVRDRFVFLNYLLSARPPEQIAALFAAIRPQVQRIDLAQTSKYLDPQALQAFRDRLEAARHGQPQAAASGVVRTAPEPSAHRPQPVGALSGAGAASPA